MALYKEKAGPMLTEINALIIQNAGATADDGIDGRTIEPGSGRKRRLRNNRVEDALIDAQGKLEVLRKGCCHPQILDPSLTGRRLRGDFQDRRPRPFKDIIILKVEQARLIVAEKQRSLLAHVCKFAGIQLLFAQLSMQRSDDNSMVDSDSNSKRHLKQALRAYLWCWELIHGSNRNILPLLATATSSSNVCVELSLISDPTSICTGFQCMELASSKDERVDNSGSVDMLWSLRGSTAKTLTNAPLPLLLSVPHSHALLDPGLHYDLHFTNKKRLISGNLYVSLDVKYILAQVRQRSAMLGLSMELLDTVKSSFRNFSALSPIEITSSSTTQYIAPANCETVELLRILLPEIVVVQQIVGTQDTAVNIAECRFEFDIRNLLSDITDEIECALDVKEGQRSRNWRVLVKSLHSNCMVLKGYRDRDSHSLSHYWISWENIGKLPIEASSRSDHYLGSFVAMRGEFLEADIEVDAFQVNFYFDLFSILFLHDHDHFDCRSCMSAITLDML